MGGVRVKNFFQTNPPTLRNHIGKSIRKLKVQQYKIGQVSVNLKKRDQILFKRCVRSLKDDHKERANICASEVSAIRRLMKFLYHVDLAIERVILRLETIRELSDIIIDLKPALRMLQNVSKQLFEHLPEVSSELNKINDVISETLCTTKIRTNGINPTNSISHDG